ncbi:hypothetical protein PSTT_15538, partial [Puccinia striiformis]
LYFIFVVYSFALHLQQGSYTKLPLPRPPSTTSTTNQFYILPTSSSPADPAVFRPKLNDHHLPANIRAGSTDLETNNSSNKFS